MEFNTISPPKCIDNKGHKLSGIVKVTNEDPESSSIQSIHLLLPYPPNTSNQMVTENVILCLCEFISTLIIVSTPNV